MIFFISQALADESAKQSNMFMSFLPMVAFIGILYFLLIRPQQKRAKQHQTLISSIKKGDKVITNSGMIATVSKIVNEQEVVLEIAEGTHCKFLKSAISSMLEKTTEEAPAPAPQKEIVAKAKEEKTPAKPVNTVVKKKK